MTYTKPGRIQEVILEHRAIVNALQKHDSSASYEAMKKHVEKSGQIFLKMAYSNKNSWWCHLYAVNMFRSKLQGLAILIDKKEFVK